MAKEYIDKDQLMAKINAWEESTRNGTNPNCKNGNEYEAAMDIVIMVEEEPADDPIVGIIIQTPERAKAISDWFANTA